MRIDYRQLKPYRDYQRNRMLERRLLLLRILVAAGFLLFGGVFWYLQIVKGREYRLKAEENRLRRRIVRPVRGPLLDDSGELLASNRPTFSVYLDRRRTRDPSASVRELARLLGRPETPLLERLEEQASRPAFLPVRLLEDVDLDVAARIEAHRAELGAIDVVVEARRSYPLGPAAAHVVGYTSEVTGEELAEEEGLLPGDRVGRTGAEAAFDRSLRGRPGIVLEEVNARGRPIRAVATVRRAEHGRPLGLTIDADLQRDLAREFGRRAGAAVMLDPRTGAVKALFSSPSFDPNLFTTRLRPEAWEALAADPRRALQNRAIGGLYSPGSTFKLVMAAAGLEEGVVEPDERIVCRGSATFHGRRFRCHRRWGHGPLRVREAIARSCNIFFYNVGDRLGIERIAAWARRFGLGSRTGVPLAGEAEGLVPDPDWKRRTRHEPWFPGETISVSIGQGPLMVTPLQMAVVAATIASGGRRPRPALHEPPGAPPPGRDVGLSPRTLEEVRSGMIDVVESEHGTARAARIPGVLVAGKTGTAQVVGLDAGSDPGDHSWFVGFAPADAPVLAWAILVEHGGHGGEAAAPIAGRVVRRYLERRGLLPREGAVRVAQRRRP
ncbi:MAG: penicillin-binding protein 2 [Acidobacteria bacterium]|nr:MAG: penicillin-binding protein 2 [Acidobacteriota bacterium]